MPQRPRRKSIKRLGAFRQSHNRPTQKTFSRKIPYFKQLQTFTFAHRASELNYETGSILAIRLPMIADFFNHDVDFIVLERERLVPADLLSHPSPAFTLLPRLP